MRWSTNKEVRVALEWAFEHGWVCSKTNGGHLKLMHPRGGLVIVSCTPSDSPHIRRKIIGDLRREEKKWTTS